MELNKGFFIGTIIGYLLGAMLGFIIANYIFHIGWIK